MGLFAQPALAPWDRMRTGTHSTPGSELRTAISHHRELERRFSCNKTYFIYFSKN